MAAIVGGAVALFTADNGAASVLLLTLGIVLVLAGWLGPRVQLESFELLGAKLRVREVVAQRLRLAEPPASRDPEADSIRRQAATLQTLDRLYGLYGYVRATQPASDRRTATLDRIATRMQAAAQGAEFDAAEVATWFHDGTDPLRIVALNVMLAHEGCRDLLAVLRVIDEPHNLFEQYYALVLAQAMIPDLDELERALVADAVRRARRRRRFRRDRPLMARSQAVLAMLGTPE
jgi:hypothetical protein